MNVEKLEKSAIKKWRTGERSGRMRLKKILTIEEDTETKNENQIIETAVTKKKNRAQEENARVEGNEKEIEMEKEIMPDIPGTDRGIGKQQKDTAGTKEPKKGQEVEIETDGREEEAGIKNGKEIKEPTERGQDPEREGGVVQENKSERNQGNVEVGQEIDQMIGIKKSDRKNALAKIAPGARKEIDQADLQVRAGKKRDCLKRLM